MSIAKCCFPDVNVCYKFAENYAAMMIGEQCDEETLAQICREFKASSPSCPGTDSLACRYIVPGAVDSHIVPTLRYLWMQIVAHEGGSWSIQEARRFRDIAFSSITKSKTV
jgi:hypothetical protein